MASSHTTFRAGPGQVYYPSNSLSLGYDNDGENGGRRWRGSISLTAIFRLVVTGFALADIIVWFSLSLISIRYSSISIVFVELFLVVGWNLFLVIPPSLIVRIVPAFLCPMGDCTSALNGEDTYDRLPKKAKTKPQKQRKLVRRAMVDVVLGLSIMMIMAVGWPRLPIWYNYRQSKQCLFSINMVVGGLELGAALLSLLDCFWSLDLEFGVVLRHIDDPDTRTRVQLAPDKEYRRTAGGIVSIVA